MLAGAPTAQAAMAGLRQQYCRPLASSDYAQIGVSQQGRAGSWCWRVRW